MNKRQSVITALVASVAINLLFAGVLLGRWTRPPQPPPLSWAVQSLSPESREELRSQMEARRGEVRPLRENMREAMTAVRDAASAEPFDRAALDAALGQVREAQQDYQAFLHQNVVDMVASLPREERLAVLRRALEHGGRGDKRPPPHPPASR